MRRLATLLLLGGVLVMTGSTAAVAADDCTAEDGLPVPDCDPGFLTPEDPGMPAGFVVLVVLGLVVSVGIGLYKVSMARDMASRSGMDPDEATAMTLLTDDGLEATYLASSLRPETGGPVPPTTPGHTNQGQRNAAQRLTEIDELLRQELITQAEYDERRAAILGSL